MVQGFTMRRGLDFCLVSWRAIERLCAGSQFCFEKITLTPEWLMGWCGKEGVKETNQEATAALPVRGDGQETGCPGGAGGGE